MTPPELVAEFHRELPFYLRCTALTAEKSAYQVARYLREHIEPFPACFTRSEVIAYLSRLASTPPRRRDKPQREASSVNDVLKGLRRFAKWCVARGYLSSDVTEGIKFLRVRDRIILAPELPDVRKLLRAARDYGESAEIRARNYSMVSLLIDTGLRAEELLRLDVCGLFAGRRFVRRLLIRGKGDKERYVPLTPYARSVLRPYLRLRRPMVDETALFVDWSGQRMTYPALRNTVQRIGDRIGVSIALHDFRRYTHTRLYAKGIDSEDGKFISGHSNSADYRVYIRGEHMKRAVREAAKRSPLAEVMAGD